MKVIAYAVRPDEKSAFNQLTKKLDIEVKYVAENLSLQNAKEAQGFECVAIIGNCNAGRATLCELKDLGVKYVATRTAGYNNIDVEAAKEFGIRISNAAYSPNCVADFAVMLMLMSIRKVNYGIKRGEVGDYTLRGLQGREMHNLTVGVIGTGRIGQAVIKNLSGFGCKIIANDLYPNEAMKEYVEYVDLETLFAHSDIITLHAPLFESNYHLINKESIKLMKEDVVIINTSRGELINTYDLIEGLESGKVGAAGLDVLEGELGIYHNDHRFDTVYHKELHLLKQMPNVTLTHHFAFYTDQAVLDMVECALQSLKAFNEGIENPAEIK